MSPSASPARGYLRPLLAIALFLYICGSTSLTSTFVPAMLDYGLDASSVTKTDPPKLLDGCGATVKATSRGNATEKNESIKEKPRYCSEEHRRAVEYCSAPNHNVVLMREGTKNARIRSWGTVRPYSVSPAIESDPLPRCRNLDEYLSAIKHGTRSWPYTSEKIDRKRSVFVPFGCYVPSLPPSPTKTCKILDRYSHVVFHGDSLTRHLRQAMYMSLRGDYVKGGLVTNDATVHEKCVCDGQYSESMTCRKFELYFNELIRPQDVPGENDTICPDATFVLGKREMKPYLTRKGQIDPGESIDWDDVNCSDESYRGILIVLQGGPHWVMNASDTFDSLILPVIAHEKYRECDCMGKVHLVWTSMSAQSTALDDAFPHQRRENALIFNDKMTNLFVSADLTLGEEVTILDWWNFTADAQSSDGLHYLTDVNLAKAAQILYLADHWPFPGPRGKDDKLDARRCIDIRISQESSQQSESSSETTVVRPMPRKFTNKRGESIIIPHGAPLPPASFLKEQGIHAN